mmetsp:Transcript_89759/g.253117  ORF Transcript_89759/g.253117 Transcript_89759/m.253117 type:complete len:547 (-) Transcript_89759:81-1721(-)
MVSSWGSCCLDGPFAWLVGSSKAIRQGFVPIPARTIGQRLASESVTERVFALESLVQAGPEGLRHADTVVCMLEDPAWIVRDAAAQALLSFGGSAAKTIVVALEKLSERREDPVLQFLAMCVSDDLVGRFEPDAGVDATTEVLARPSMMQDRSKVLNVLRLEGRCLRYAAEELRQDREVVFVAVQQCGIALRYASHDLRGDFEVACAAVQSDPRALQFVAEEIRTRNFIAEGLENYLALLSRWQFQERAVFTSDVSLPPQYLERRPALIKLVQELARALESADSWTQALGLLDAFFSWRGARQPVHNDLAVASVMIVVRSVRTRLRYKDALTTITACLQMCDSQPAIAQALHCAELFIFTTLSGRVLLPSVPNWTVAILARLELRAFVQLEPIMGRLREAACEIAELVAVRVPACAALPPRALARGACAIALTHFGLLPSEDANCLVEAGLALTSGTAPALNHDVVFPRCASDSLLEAVASTEFVQNEGKQDIVDFEDVADALSAGAFKELDMGLLAWAAGCGVGQLRTDVQAVLHAAAPVIAPAA